MAGQSVESYSLRVSLHASSWSLPLGPSVCTVILWAPLSTQSSHTAVLQASLHSCYTQLSSGPLCTAVTHSRPLGLSAQSCTQLSSGPLSLVLPPLQPLLCSPAALQPCHRVMPKALGRALYIESTDLYCPQVCSELVNHGQVRILATGTLILSTGGHLSLVSPS